MPTGAEIVGILKVTEGRKRKEKFDFLHKPAHPS